MPISRLSATSCVGLEPRPLPSTGVTQLRRYYGPLRDPSRPSLSLAGVWLRGSAPRRSGFPCCVDLRVPTCRRHYPGGPLGSDRSWDGLFHPFPVPQRRRPSPSECKVGATLVVSRPARRSRVLRPVGSPSRHAARLSRRLRRFCYLHRRSDSYRLERPSCRVGIAPTEEAWSDCISSPRLHKTGGPPYRECVGLVGPGRLVSALSATSARRRSMRYATRQTVPPHLSPRAIDGSRP